MKCKRGNWKNKPPKAWVFGYILLAIMYILSTIINFVSGSLVDPLTIYQICL
ncbi:hypothetical protein TREPR_2335 [Treponema primitia ZAS-2]|uniref:Uncharacterized protein n=1 Tax=Treponema primitia (strain ATCC BAA-887 / DSM 12427 / ZAS-2) TaxID=545694 RepID=F5YHX1_TREPZ|nr:hypothetical protein TREPR_2335 [Treponema primitia ZAS-2]